ncbi:MAG: hypothetical protein ACE5EB_09525 [Thermodesulfobacteriota bacterium]
MAIRYGFKSSKSFFPGSVQEDLSKKEVTSVIKKRVGAEKRG